MKLTLKELQDLTPEDLNTKVAECCGWTEIHVAYFMLRGSMASGEYDCEGDEINCLYDEPIPDYVFSMSAICDAWREHLGYFSDEWIEGYRNLCLVLDDDLAGYVRCCKKSPVDNPPERVQEHYLAAVANAKPIQRAWAFVLTLQKEG
jgi:hypothetical protein